MSELGGSSTTLNPEFRNEFKIFFNLGGPSTTFDPELRNEFKNFSNPGGSFHNFWSWTLKWILKFFQSGGSILQLFILNWEMKEIQVSCNIKCITAISNLQVQ